MLCSLTVPAKLRRGVLVFDGLSVRLQNFHAGKGSPSSGRIVHKQVVGNPEW